MKQIKVVISLACYDIIIFTSVTLALFVLYTGNDIISESGIIAQTIIAFISIFGARSLGKIYRQIWRYGGIQCYIRLLVTDAIAFIIYLLLERILPIQHIVFTRLLAFSCMNTLGSLSIRMVYRYCYKCGNKDTNFGRFLRGLLDVFSFGRVQAERDPHSRKIRIAIIGAGSVGVGLAEDLLNNPQSKYIPRCFIDIDPEKEAREIHGLRVLKECDDSIDMLKDHHIQEVVFAIPNAERDKKYELFEYYQKAGFKIKVFDAPSMDTPGATKRIRDFDISDLLFREEKIIISESTTQYYRDKTILITGGGGSIGSELCRQLARMNPKQLIILDIYENTAYELQQELKFEYKSRLDIRVEIVSITNKRGLARVFRKYRPDICINAAAHKHVPLMENNCIEAVENNVFGTLNVVECCEEYGCERFMMVSTDKAVNPTNVMGATKRACEMIMQAYSTKGTVKCSATRFGNVLGSAGSVIPLFKRQILAGGPITITDKRIIRYFMTIPEASQLVLASGAMAQNGDLFVLDMGQPVKIWDLAVNMIELMEAQNIEIVETGLRPGEKLYEELLVDKNTLDKTENDLIFIEHEVPVTLEQLDEKLKLMKEACAADDDNIVRDTMRIVVPTFRTPEEVNGAAIRQMEQTK